MRQLKCEVCGSTDLVKQNGLYVCQSCGMKYSLEEVRKLTVEGTVKVDNTDRVNNLYTSARKARDINDLERAANFYDMILQEEPDSWEANFYSVYCSAASCKIAQIKSSSKLIANNFPIVLGLIHKSVPDNKQASIVDEVVTRINNLYINMGETSYNFYLPYEDLISCAADLSECAADVMSCGDAVAAEFAGSKQIAKKAIPLYETAMGTCKTALDLRPSTLDPYTITGSDRAKFDRLNNQCNEKRLKLNGTNSTKTDNANTSNTSYSYESDNDEMQDLPTSESSAWGEAGIGCLAFFGIVAFVVIMFRSCVAMI